MHNKRDCSYDGLQCGKINWRGLNLKLKFPYVNEVFLKTLSSTKEHMTWNVSFLRISLGEAYHLYLIYIMLLMQTFNMCAFLS